MEKIDRAVNRVDHPAQRRIWQDRIPSLFSKNRVIGAGFEDRGGCHLLRLDIEAMFDIIARE